MGYSFDRTHERILESARISFMQNGFSGASIRQICNDAGVTNGAFYSHFDSKEDLFAELVEPVIKGMGDLYSEESSRFDKIRSAKEFGKVLDKAFVSDRIMIHYIYEHADIFRLLLTSSAGTKYEKLPEQLAATETEDTLDLLNHCKMFISRPENISKVLITRISFFVINTIFESFLSGNPEDETVKQTQIAAEFCITGLKQILGI